MSTINSYKSYQQYLKEYSTWREDKNIQEKKRQEYLRRNPDFIKDYDLQRAKILLNAVDFMDKSICDNSDNIGTAFETAANLGLGYAAIGGATLGILVKKIGFVKNNINKIIQKHPKSKNIINTGITSIFGILGIIGAYPIYTLLSKFQTKINRKRRFETMENELNDPRIFVVLDENQKKIFKENLEEIEKNKPKTNLKDIAEKDIKNYRQLAKEVLYYEKEQKFFKEKYKENNSFYEKDLTEKEIKNAKKDMVLLLTLIKEINTKSQSYTEKIERITNNLIALSFALGSLFTLIYERVAKSLKLKTSSLPAGFGIALFVGSTFFANWAQKQASQIGRFKAKQDLLNNPEKLVYISKNKTNSINEEEIVIENNKKQTTSFKFLKEFFKNNKEYNQWKKSKNLTGNDISKAMEGLELSSEQIKDGKRLQENMFKTFYKIDKNTQNYSGQIDAVTESIKYPITLVFGTFGSIWGMKHLVKLRSSKTPFDIFKQTMKYIGTITLFTIPTMLINSYFANAKKMSARICDMLTMKDLEDYRFFADYSRFKDE